ncbi:MAG: ABC transporter permease [candidate division NC10 bacterium]|nr:ABC transporter permease [candidate division NC10 bacterium]
MIEAKPLYVIFLRELTKFVRQRSALINAFARPILWLVVVGTGLSQIVRGDGLYSYKQFIFPGIIGMTVLFSSIFSSISIVWDREFGFMREMLVAPISRLSIVLGKAVSGTLISALQAAVIMAFIPLLGIKVSLSQLLTLLGLAVLVSFSLTSLGILIASRLETFGVFNVVMNFLVMPMFFLSGALYPVTLLPAPLQVLSRLNPLTYGVDAFKNVLLGQAIAGNGAWLGAEFPLSLDVSVVTAFGLVTIILGAVSFRRMG